MFCNLSVALDIISCGFLTFALSIFIYWVLFSAERLSDQTWLFGTFFLGGLFLKIVQLLFNAISLYYKKKMALNVTYKWIMTIVLTIIFTLAILRLGFIYLIPINNKVIKFDNKFLIISFCIIPFCIISLSRFSIKIPIRYREIEFKVSSIFLLLCMVLVELHTLGPNKFNLLSSIWYFVPGNLVKWRYIYVFSLSVLALLTFFLLYKLFYNNRAKLLFIQKKNIILSLLFSVFIIFSILYRKRVNFTEDWDFVLHSFGGIVHFKYPLVYLLPQYNYYLFKNWLCPDTAYMGFCYIVGIVIVIQMFRLWRLLWPKDLMRSIMGQILTLIPYGTAQLFFGYNSRRMVSLLFLICLIYYAIILIKQKKGFLKVGIFAGLTFCSHNMLMMCAFPAIALVCYFAIEGEKLSKKALSIAKCIIGFAVVYIVVYGIIGYLKWFYIILFNHKDPEIMWELSSMLTLDRIFGTEHLPRLFDNMNGNGPIGVLLLLTLYLGPLIRIFTGDKKIAIFLGVLTIGTFLWVFSQFLPPFLYNFDQFITPYIAFNIFGIYMWLASCKSIKGLFLPIVILIAVFGSYSASMIKFMHEHRDEVNYSFKSEPQAELPSEWNLVDRLDFGNYSSEKKHGFKISGSKNDWSTFYKKEAYSSHGVWFMMLVKPRDVIRVLFFYENHEAVVDEGRLCSGNIEFIIKTKKDKKLLLLWRTAGSIKGSIKNSPLEIMINGERVGELEMGTPIKIKPERKLNDYIWREPPFPFPIGIWDVWQEFEFEIPERFIKGDEVHIKIISGKDLMQMYYLWIYAGYTPDN